MPRRRWIFKVVVPLLVLSLGLIGAEFMARLIAPRPRYGGWLPVVPNLREVRENVNLRGVSPTMVYTANDWGLRGSTPPAQWDESFTVLAIGGSTTRCGFLDDTKTWPHLLEQRLRVDLPTAWIGNAGFNGHTTRGHVLAMDKIVRDIRPDAAVLLIGINDLTLSLDASQTDYDLVNATDRLPGGLLSGSRLFQLAFLWKRANVDDVIVHQGAGHVSLEPQPVDPSVFSPLPEDLRAVLPSLPAFRANLGRIVDIARECNTQVLFMTQPLWFSDTERWRTVHGSAYWVEDEQLVVSAATLARMMDVFNAELQAFCLERGVPCFDLANQIPRTEANFYDLCHFTEAGAALVAEQAERGVRQHLLPAQ
ncbi:SGNH/GDSL hydrolase family protein [Planctomycetota bacterium]|nr:SGNH/GDSL hydrolase family protein [Planctomycetota bacterium]